MVLLLLVKWRGPGPQSYKSAHFNPEPLYGPSPEDSPEDYSEETQGREGPSQTTAQTIKASRYCIQLQCYTLGK